MMRVVEPQDFKAVKRPKAKRTKRPGKLFFILVVITVYLGFAALRPIPALHADVVSVSIPAKKDVSIAWPDYGQAAVGAVGYGILDTHGTPKALPTASVAKVMTALAVLKQKPLNVGEKGPIITINQSDVEEYNRTIAMDGSNVPVQYGEEITEYEALQALLLPSANNIAHTLVRWAYGSDDKYLAFVNNFAKSLGMTNTQFADASGYDSQTVSTAEDLVKLAVNAMDNPVIAEIAAQKEAIIPVAGRIFNVNMLLGKDAIVGVKTGNTEAAGGCFMAAAVREINGHKVIAVSVIMGAPNLSAALRDSVPLIRSVLDGFEYQTVIKANQPVGSYSVAGQSVDAVVNTDVAGVVWRSKPQTPIIKLNTLLLPTPTESRVGAVTMRFGRDSVEVPVVTHQALRKPTLISRLIPQL